MRANLLKAWVGGALGLLVMGSDGHAEAWRGTVSEILSGTRFTLCGKSESCRKIRIWGIAAPEESDEELENGEGTIAPLWIESFGYPDDRNVGQALLRLATANKTIRCSTDVNRPMPAPVDGSVVAQCWALTGNPFDDDFRSVDLGGFLVQQLGACDLASITGGFYVDSYGGKTCPEELSRAVLTPLAAPNAAR